MSWCGFLQNSDAGTKLTSCQRKGRTKRKKKSEERTKWKFEARIEHAFWRRVCRVKINEWLASRNAFVMACRTAAVWVCGFVREREIGTENILPKTKQTKNFHGKWRQMLPGDDLRMISIIENCANLVTGRWGEFWSLRFTSWEHDVRPSRIGKVSPFLLLRPLLDLRDSGIGQEQVWLKCYTVVIIFVTRKIP